MPWISKKRWKEVNELRGRVECVADQLREMKEKDKVYTGDRYGASVSTNIAVKKVLDHLGLRIDFTPAKKAEPVLVSKKCEIDL